MRVFVDSSAYIAILNPNDPHHQKALERLNWYTGKFFFTSQAIVSEVCTVGAMRYDKSKTIRFVQQMFDDTELTVVRESPELINKTWKIFQQVKDKNVSFVDCHCIAVMQTNLIKEIFTFDKHFDKLVAEFL